MKTESGVRISFCDYSCRSYCNFGAENNRGVYGAAAECGGIWLCLGFLFFEFGFAYHSDGAAYAIWSGGGVVLISIIGAFLYHQRLDWAAFVGIAMIVGGVVVIRVFSRLV